MPDFFGSKLSWTLCLVVSLLYFVLFVLVANGRLPKWTNSLLFGFCVWGTPNIPDKLHGCYEESDNSHVFAFCFDAVVTGVVAVLYVWQKRIETLRFVAIGGIIFSHGLLHLMLFKGLNCYISPDDLPKIVVEFGYILFAAFTFALSVVTLFFGLVTKGYQDLTGVLLASAMATAVVVFLCKDTGSEWALPALFSVSHPLSSATGLWTKNPAISSEMGWAFLLATLVGIVELTSCLSFYRAIGGHLWYDVTLHIAVVMSLPPFAPTVPRAPKKATSAGKTKLE